MSAPQLDFSAVWSPLRAIKNTPDPSSLPAPKGQWDVPSAEAAQKMIGVRAHQQARLLEWLLVNGPATDEQCAAGAGIGGNSIRGRRGELVELGMVVKVDHDGVTSAGNRATRWAVHEDAEWSGKPDLTTYDPEFDVDWNDDSH